jgi:Prenyltransferase and squalene oxidase repeat
MIGSRNLTQTGTSLGAFALLELFVLLGMAAGARAADTNAPARPVLVVAPVATLAAALPPEKWHRVEDSVDRALAWLASQQAADGSFPTLPVGQPAVTSLCVMAFLSRGHQPGLGPYGQQLNRAIDFVLSCQREDGLLSFLAPEPEFQFTHASQTASYDHAIAGLMLGEVYGDVTGQRARNVRAAIAKAITYTRALQTRKKPYAVDEGGVRYVRLRDVESDSDLSITAWHLMFLRSARNAEFKVPQKYMDDGVAYIRRCWDPDQQMFNYIPSAGNGGPAASRGMTGAGIVSLSMAGEHNTPMARAAGDWLVAHPYGSLGDLAGPFDRFYYSAYYCGQAAAQLGGHYWERIYPPLADALLNAQEADGSFPLEPKHDDAPFGRTYITAMAVLALTPAYQLLPVYQR